MRSCRAGSKYRRRLAHTIRIGPVLIEKDGAERLYFVVETKGSLFKDDLRHKEGAKIACGKAHFGALAVDAKPARYEVATSLDNLLKKAS